MSPLAPDVVATAYRNACLAEVRALKPGNVHVHADGHGMKVADFERSAAASAPHLAAPGRRVGERVLSSVRATRACVGTNTNLGIILLCAPLAAAAERHEDLFAALRTVLSDLDRQDARDVFEAIRLASPGGLGRVPLHDVQAPPETDLLTAMRAAEADDRIARAYVTGFDDIVTVGRPSLAAARENGLAPEWCATAVYMAFLARFRDTHIRRKHDDAVAESVRSEAELLLTQISLTSADAPAALLAFDRDLKQRGLNPGTSADFTVATLFADDLSSSALT